MPAETAVNVIWRVKVFTFCLSPSLQRNLAQCSERESRGHLHSVAPVPVFSSLGEVLLWSFAVLWWLSFASQTPVMWYSLQHSITRESTRTVLCPWMQTWSCSDSCWLPLTVSMLPIEKKFSLHAKEVVRWGRKWKQSTGMLQDGS